ncbi:MAG: hypothetical protein ACYC61_04735 [Isosphaeraceae bacterium]
MGLLLVGIFAIGHLAGAAQKEQEILRANRIQAERFELRGPDDVLRAAFFKGPKGEAHLSFFGDDGKTRLSLGIGDDGLPSLSMYDNNKKMKLGLSIDHEGGNPQLVLLDDSGEPAVHLGVRKDSGPDVTVGRKGKGRVSISLSKDGEPSLQLQDERGDPRVALGLSHGLPSISLMAGNNVLRSSWSVRADGSAALSIHDSNAKPRLVIGVDRDGKPSIKVMDPAAGTEREIK